MKKLTNTTIGKRILANTLSLMLVLMSIPMGSANHAFAAASVTTISVDKGSVGAEGGSVTITVTGTDLTSGVLTITGSSGLQVSDPAIGSDSATATATATIPANNTVADVVYTFTANLSGVSTGKLVTVTAKESVAPVIADAAFAPTDTWAKSRTISATVTDAGSGVDEVFCSTDAGAAAGTGVAFTKAADSDVWTSGAITTADKYFVIAIDNNGNRSVTAATVAVTNIDTTAPTISTPTVAPTDTWAKSRTISATVTDSDSGIARVFYTTTQGASTGTAMEKKSGDTYSFTVTTGGTYYIVAVDNVGNKRESSVNVTNIDTTAPTIAYSITYSGRPQSPIAMTVTGNISDTGGSGLNTSRVEFNTASAQTIPLTLSGGAFSVVLPIQDGCSITAYDNAGNGKTVTINVDRTSPVIESAVQNTSDWAKSKTLCAVVADQGSGASGVDYVYYHKTGDAQNQTEMSLSEGAWVSGSISEEGKYTIVAVDKAGNSSTTEVTVTQIDTTAPSNLSIEYSSTHSLIEKVLKNITFGFYNEASKVTVTLYADDMPDSSGGGASGVQFFSWKYTKESDAGGGILESKEDTALTASLVSGETNRYSAFFELPADAEQYFGTISFTATDKAGNVSASHDGRTPDDEQNNLTGRGIVIDTIAPQVDVTISGNEMAKVDANLDDAALPNDNTRLVFDGDIIFQIDVKDANFYLKTGSDADDFEADDITISVEKTLDGVPESYSMEFLASDWESLGNDTWRLTKTITGDGDYVITVNYTDRSGNQQEWTSSEYSEKSGIGTYTSNTLTIDMTDPVVSITDWSTSTTSDTYDAARTAIIQVTDRNFRPEEFTVETLEALNLDGDTVALWDSTAKADFAAALRSRNGGTKDGVFEVGKWTKKTDTDTWEVEVTFIAAARYAFAVKHTDLAGNESEVESATPFVIDYSAPDSLTISYSTSLLGKIISSITFGYYNPSVEVTLSAEDALSGVDYFEWIYTRETGASTDKNAATETGIIDSGIEYTENDKKATAKFTLTGDTAKQYRGSIQFTATDRSGNKSGDLDDVSKHVVVVDTIAPQAVISYSGSLTDRVKPDATKDTMTTPNGTTRMIYSGSITATVEITDANFYPNSSVDAADYDSGDVLITVSKTLDGQTTDYPLSYTKADWQQAGDKWTLAFALAGDGDYVVTVTYKDRSQNDMNWTVGGGHPARTGSTTYVSNTMTIDTTAPAVTVTYDPVSSQANNDTYKANRTATIQITDRNFRPYEFAPVFSAKTIQGKDIASSLADINAKGKALQKWSAWSEKSVNVWEATITFSADARYEFTLDYQDLAKNKMRKYTATPFVVDKTAPANLKTSYSTSLLDKVISSISFGYYKPSVIVTLTAEDEVSGVDHFNWVYSQQSGTSTTLNRDTQSAQIDTGKITYSNSGKTATASFKLTGTAAVQYRGSIRFSATDKTGNKSGELKDTKRVVVVDTLSPTRTVTYPVPRQIVNRKTLETYDGDMEIYVNREKTSSIFYYDDDVTATLTVTEANFYAKDVSVKVNGTNKSVKWKQDGDSHTAEITLSGDGDYVITMNYTDRSTNKMVDYQSEQITIDTIAPKVAVSYEPNQAIDQVGGRRYYDTVQTATITITEHNFRAEDVAVSLTAQDVTGSDINAALLARLTAHLAERSSWTRNGDRHTATISYSADGNYTFAIGYTDLALRTTAEYTPDLLTVDTTAPENLSISYSSGLFETVLEAVSFGYYNAAVTVTLTADDAVAGIRRFTYGYRNADGVSGVNAQSTEQTIENTGDDIQYTNDGMTATATFQIPGRTLQGDNQFNGTVELIAYDRADNDTEEPGAERIVVDNIAPTATISYNEPVQNVNNISYYAGDINATIQITEANFFSQDVTVTATRGGAEVPLDVTWVDDSADLHTGTFTLTGDGDYLVRVSYADRSENNMADYLSNQLTIDTQAPTVRIDGVANESANNAAAIGFTITADDTNFDTSKFIPKLEGVIMNADGVFETKTIPNGELQTITAGKTYAYTIQIPEDADTDGIYTLSCSVTDLANNTINEVAVSESNNASMPSMTFSVNRTGSTFMLDNNTSQLIDAYYVQDVLNDVVIIETNADPLLSYKVTLQGRELTEGTDYTVTKDEREGSWKKYTYNINKSLFTEEGEYKIVISSRDKAENAAYSDIKSAEVSYVVDRTAPVLTISGLQDNGRYQVEAQTVTVIPKDDGGMLKSIKATVAEGNSSNTALDLSGDTLLDALDSNGGKLTFEIPSGYNQNVQILCDDMAQDESGNTNLYDRTFSSVTVSTNAFVIFRANTPLFVGTIGGTAAVFGGLCFFLVFRRRKKRAAKAKAEA